MPSFRRPVRLQPSGLVTANVRNDGEVARALHRRRELTLMTGADAAQPARQNLAVVGDETAKRTVILVVDESNARLAEWAGFLGSAHGLVLVLIIFVAPTRGEHLFLGHWRRTDLVFVERDEVAHNAVVELERALVL